MPTKSSKSKAKTQEFRSALARIKRAGLANIKNPKTAKATKANKAIVQKFGKVASGKSLAVSISAARAKQYRDAKHSEVQIVKLAGGKFKAIVSKQTGYSKAQISKGEPIFEGMVARVRPMKNGEIEKILLPIRRTSIPNFIEQLRTNPEWDKLKMSKDRFTLRFNFYDEEKGLNNPAQFGTMEQLATFLQGYKSSVRASKSTRHSQREYLEHLEILRIKRNEHDLRDADQIRAAKDRERLKRRARVFKKKFRARHR